MTIAAIMILLAVLLVVGLPVALAMGLAGAIGLYLVGGWPALLGVLRTSPLSSANNYEIITIPMFILMAEFVIISGVAKDMFRSASIWMGRVRGGLAMATALAGAGFAAISGSSTAAAATLASTSLPAMVESGYDTKLAAGAVAISGTLAMLIPPSIALILYGIIADIPIGPLLIAGVVPGILVTLTIMATIYVVIRLDSSAAPPGQRYSMREKLASLKHVGPMLVLLVAVTGLIYSGITTPTESSAIGALVAMLLAIRERRLDWRGFVRALTNTAHTSGMILFIILGAQIFGYFITMTMASASLAEWVGSLQMPALLIMALILVLYVILGFFMDQVAILILTVPVLLPVVMKLGFDPIWFGVIIVVTAEVGMITPPMGMNVFVVSRYTDISLKEIFQGVFPHFWAHLIIIAILTLFPMLTLWLPSKM